MEELIKSLGPSGVLIIWKKAYVLAFMSPIMDRKNFTSVSWVSWAIDVNFLSEVGCRD